MATVGKISGALAQATQETTLALATLNFDFAIIKHEAPVEYHALGASLSKKRRVEAEDGSIHTTARKLGALFESITPEVPNLIEAYGRRASEIAASPVANPKGSKSHGAFEELIGADGTSIWASATSGRGAVVMHLLACMLARMWKAAEAISIWSELVAHRRAQLANKIGDSTSFSAADMTASRIDIPQGHLADWDASARSWIASADIAKSLQHTQLRLVMDNISLPVSRKPDLYPSVVETWSKAMLALEELLLGRPQRIQSGAVLLGLSAWHLYPDMSVLQSTNRHIAQNDPLMNPASLISVGLESRPSKVGEGIYWSLPLANLRYYGPPTVTTRHSGGKDSQLLFDDFRYVIFGSVISAWGSTGPDLSVACRLICHIAGYIPSSRARHPHAPPVDHHWLRSLAQTSAAVQHHIITGQREQLKLVEFGRRRCRRFLQPTRSKLPPVFGLTNVWQTIEDSLPVCPYRFEAEDIFHCIRMWLQSTQNPEFFDGAHIRMCDDILNNTNALIYCSECLTISGNHGALGWNPQLVITRWTRGSELANRSKGRRTTMSGIPPDSSEAGSLGRDQLPFWPNDHCSADHEVIYGDFNSMAIIRPIIPRATKSSEGRTKVPSPGDLLEGLEAQRDEYGDLVRILFCPTFQALHREYFHSMEILFGIERLYDQLPGAMIDLQIVDRPLYNTSLFDTLRKWKSNAPQYELPHWPLHLAFACIASLESGLEKMPSEQLEEVIAITYGNSLYVATFLLDGPDVEIDHAPVRRFTGNIGKSGLSLLMTPAQPLIRDSDLSSWRIVEHVPFKGEAVDSFASTSLHLSFTGYELPLDVGPRGGRIAEAALVEVAVSLHESGKWVADLDLISAKAVMHLMRPLSHCSHERSKPPDDLQLLTMVNWTEFLDPPDRSCVFLACGNAMARLAAVALCKQKGYKCRILRSKDPCWDCALDNLLHRNGTVQEIEEDLRAMFPKVFHHMRSAAAAKSDDSLDKVDHWLTEQTLEKSDDSSVAGTDHRFDRPEVAQFGSRNGKVTSNEILPPNMTAHNVVFIW